MTNNQIASFLMIILGIMITILLVLVTVYIVIRLKSKQKDKVEVNESKPSNKTKVQQLYNVQSVFNFMEFDKIEDNMIVQKDGKRFLMVVKCQGINYDLMSAVEKNSVEQGFIQYLNTLRNPIQIYIQTRKVDLTGSIETYKQKVKDIGDNLARMEYDYNQKVRNGQSSSKNLDAEKFEIVKARNLYEYGTDIVKNTERMSLNKNILTKHYYIVLSHYPEEAINSVYGQEEINNIAFSELYTKAQSTISLLSVCGINGKILDSNELADLLYSAYNRDEAELYDLNRAINAGVDSLYTTSQDVIEKRMEELDKQIEMDAIKKANDAVNEVVREREIDRQLREKERDYEYIVNAMASLMIENSEDTLGKKLVDEAKEKISNTKNKKDKKEVISNDQEQGKKTRRTRKSA